jgi:hypothetical protein
MNYPTHADWTQHLAELGFLKECHNPCLVSDHCLAKEDQDGEG